MNFVKDGFCYACKLQLTEDGNLNPYLYYIQNMIFCQDAKLLKTICTTIRENIKQVVFL